MNFAITRLLKKKENRSRLVKPETNPLLYCERCMSFGEKTLVGVAYESSRTMYVDESRNRDVALCRPCAKEHHDYWDSMWSDYYSGLL